ncbi:MAG: acetyl-CoA carboxylase carboxyltransferase subunit alpha [Hyphomicrobiales bacterium]|nr:acetyl-CoA carboxylase carboxyltransferase subunit alpha [Hyphomicrobiales bacterium]
MRSYLEFEKPFANIEGKIHELKSVDRDDGDGVNLEIEIAKLEEKAKTTLEELYSKLTPWHKTQIARHPDRPHFQDYLAGFITNFVPLAGDRSFSEDHAVIAGFGRFDGQSVAVIGQEKGNDTQSRLKRNFGMARPEGYRKAVRIMELADRFEIPIITIVDTAGAYPGIGAEERGQAEAIARSTAACLNVKVPVVSVIIGEGGSGGAIALATANRVYMLEHSIYSVISPEAGASILWRDATRAMDVANSMRITSQDLLKLGVIDGIIEEPVGGAHRSAEEVIEKTAKTIRQALEELSGEEPDQLRHLRRDKFITIGRNLT